MVYLDEMTLDDKLTDDEIRQKIETELENDLEVSINAIFEQYPHLVSYLSTRPNPRDDLGLLNWTIFYAEERFNQDQKYWLEQGKNYEKLISS
tara:strand:+ start:30 stop:308 length:279 start_codon:yes stop_codon:yes gene_type:complete